MLRTRLRSRGGGSGGSASAFAPTDISGLQLWLDASDASSITQSAGAVSQWNDKSGNANHATQGVSANQPTTGVTTLNSKNTIKFIVSPVSVLDITLSTFASITNGGNTCFAVMVPVSTGGGVLRPLSANSSGSAQRFGFYGSATKVGYIHNQAATSWPEKTFSGSLTDPRIVLGKRNGASLSVYDNGGVPTTNTSAIDFTLVAANINGANYIGSIAEIICYNSSLSDADINTIGNYLSAKWGITWTDI